MSESLDDALKAAVREALTRESQNSLGARAGVEPIAISRWLRGQRTITIQTADLLARAIGFTFGKKSRKKS